MPCYSGYSEFPNNTGRDLFTKEELAAQTFLSRKDIGEMSDTQTSLVKQHIRNLTTDNESYRMLTDSLYAVICGFITHFGEGCIDVLDWVEIGLPKEQFVNWWENHKTADAVRKESEARFKRWRELQFDRDNEELKALENPTD